jgi:hypothetical protein
MVCGQAHGVCGQAHGVWSGSVCGQALRVVRLCVCGQALFMVTIRDPLAGGIKRVSVHQEEYTDTQLIRPDDLFFAMVKYRRRYGDPRSHKNKKLGHTLSKMGGVRGVIVPGDGPDNDEPWKIRRLSGQKNKIDREEDCGSSDGDEEIAAARFDALKKNEADMYRDLAQGAMMDVMKEFELTADEAKKESSVKRKRSNKKKPAAGAGAEHKFKSFMEIAETDDESGSDPLPKRNKKSFAKAKATPADSEGDAADKPSSSSSSTGMGIEADPADKSRGAPKKDPVDVADRIWDDFRGADDRSLFFCKSSDVQRRLVVRWTNVLRTKAASTADIELKSRYEAASKRLQIVENSIKLNRNWQNRVGDVSKAFAEFDTGFKVLQSFAAGEPAQTLESSFLWHLRLQLQVVVEVLNIFAGSVVWELVF